MAEAPIQVVAGLDASAARETAGAFFAAFAADVGTSDFTELPAAKALALLLDFDDEG